MYDIKTTSVTRKGGTEGRDVDVENREEPFAVKKGGKGKRASGKRDGAMVIIYI